MIPGTRQHNPEKSRVHGLGTRQVGKKRILPGEKGRREFRKKPLGRKEGGLQKEGADGMFKKRKPAE